MKYKIGDKVQYDSGDWRFFGTVSAVFENSVSPCYRLSIERMEKKTSKFSITQFEFELEACTEDVGSFKDVRDREKRLKDKRLPTQPEMELEAVPVDIQKTESIPVLVPEKKQRKKRETGKADLVQTKEPSKRKTSNAWMRNFEQYLKGVKSYAVYNWVTNNRTHYKSGKLSDDKCEKLKEINFPFEIIRKKHEKKQKSDVPKRKRGDDWEIIFESYKNGERNDTISSWIADNRREFKNGKLTEAKYEKLLGASFPFDLYQAKDDNWEKQLEEWKKGERRSKTVQQWKQRSLKQYSENKLSVDRIIKLREVGLLK
jgi:hypothetical protein